ncbi:type VII toxin-antitoxin system MntA family adenylyltransferase antitoxin [Trichloromonas sp.]|uniref:type VII toxin-antitoxin system MntA family adenylyltransferase antitoxin n=1 Tax=Trichloromonas sp. TaxID=3069249 RepID=UPI002A397F52|nr:nucleotidyltransferase domain-containing protein [Trichloromonas sp.]
MTANTADIEAKLVQALHSFFPDLLAIYRFGSWRTEAERPASDIDLAILPAAPLDNVRRWEVAQQLATLAGRNVDLVDLLAASTVLRMQVVGHGVCLFRADENAVATFEDMVFSAYCRFNLERRDILEDIRRRGSVYGS